MFLPRCRAAVRSCQAGRYCRPARTEEAELAELPRTGSRRDMCCSSVDLCYNEVVAAVHNMISQLNSGSIIVFHLVSLGELEHARLAWRPRPASLHRGTAACADHADQRSGHCQPTHRADRLHSNTSYCSALCRPGMRKINQSRL